MSARRADQIIDDVVREEAMRKNDLEKLVQELVATEWLERWRLAPGERTQ
jgi:hypothetical protein